MEKLVCVSDFETAAHKNLSAAALDFYKHGAEDEWTLRENRKAFLRWLIKPRVLRDVSSRSISTTVLHKFVSLPLGVSPTAMQKMAHPDGEIGAVKAVEAHGSIYILSTQSTYRIEEVAEAAPSCRKWFQLYVFRDRNISAGLVKRAEAAGFEALVLTVDAPLLGRRRSMIREKFVLPENISLANHQLESVKNQAEGAYGGVMDIVMDQSLTWSDLKWLQSITKLPVIVKGIMTAEDAVIALEHGVAGIFVSNHGGRQLDYVNPTIDILPEIVVAVDRRCEIYVDGGVTCGADVFKALALGANMVFIGRPLLWGLAVGGQAGVNKVLQIYREELDLVMALSGVTNVAQITRQYLQRRSDL